MPDTIKVIKQIEENNELLALPESVSKILESAVNDDISINYLSDIISRDPALAGRVLKIANSPFYGLSHRIVSLHEAVMVLGLTTVKCLVLSAALFNRDRFKNDLAIDIPALYGNMISVAITCRKLAVACEYPAPEDAFTCGLLHEIGLLYFLHHFPREYCEVLRNAARSGNLVEEEKKLFEITHCEAGSLLARRWRLPENLASGIAHHHSIGFKESGQLDDIVRLAVAFNSDIICRNSANIEDKITRISVISSRLQISNLQLDDIAASIVREAAAFARSVDIETEDYEILLARANQELFSTYLAVQRLFKDRQELTRKILDEEREKGLFEAKQVAISTLSHYINNAAMAISGNSQVIRMSLKRKTPEEIVAMLPRLLDTIDSAVLKITAVLEELSDLNMLDGIEYYDQSRILNIDDRIKVRMEKMDSSHGLVLPKEAEITP